MSRQLCLDTIWLRPTPRLAHTEYAGTHVSLLKHVTGLDPDDPAQAGECNRKFNELWDIDFGWGVHDGTANWGAGRVTDMGHAVYFEDARDLRQAHPSPFTEVEEVWEFDPVKEYGLPDFDELVRFYEGVHQAQLANSPELLVTGGYYKSIISGAIQSFGWDMLLLAAHDQAKFAKVLERFAAYTMHHVKAWAKTSVEVFMQHDDMVWTEGPFIHPDFYRSAIFPHFRDFWKVLKDAGRKILFTADGTFDMFIDDLVDCGADGFCFEPTNSLDMMASKYGRTHVLIGSKVDCRTMTFGTWDQVRREIDATLAIAKDCPGFIFCVGNHMPANIPIEMCDQYIGYLRANWAR